MIKTAFFETHAIFSFNEFAEHVVAETLMPKIGLKDVLLPLCKKKKAYLYYLDQSNSEKHFWQRIKHVSQLLEAQEVYMKRYWAVDDTILTKPTSVNPHQFEGLVCIHPTAEIHPDAKIGPNVTIGAAAKVGEGARIVNSIILEDVVI